MCGRIRIEKVVSYIHSVTLNVIRVTHTVINVVSVVAIVS